MKKLFIAAFAAGVVGSVNAQSAFEGAYIQLGVGYEQNKVSSDSAMANTTAVNISSASKGSAQTNLGLGYNFPITKEFLLGVGAEYYALSPTLNTSDSKLADGTSAGGYSEYKVSNRYSIFLMPGYALDKERLVYAKAGYSNQKIKMTDRQTADIDAANGSSISSTSGGYVLGVGYKQMISSGFYGFGEFNYYSYSGSNFNGTNPVGTVVTGYNPTSSAYNLMVGVGYRF